MYEKAINFMKAKANGKKGFTLVELVIVILIIAVLFIFLIPQLSTMTNKAKVAGVETALRDYQLAAQCVAHEEPGFPAGEDLYTAMNGNLDEVNQIANDGSIVRKDPWGNVYVFTPKEEIKDAEDNVVGYESVTVTSYGPDATADTVDDLSTTITYDAGTVTVESDNDLAA